MSALPESLRGLFWDIDLETIDPVLHARFIAERLMEKTTPEAFRWLLSRYSREELLAVVEASRRLPLRDRNFWRLYLATA
ncbi:MAG: hypothetical protein NNA31_07975 [Nitrospira sp.]|nr:hypothetical protein [Nitrospira sp.]